MELKHIAVHQCVDKFLDDYAMYYYFNQVFDSSDVFELVNCEDIAGGTDNNGITVRNYQSAKGNEITLWIDGGFPVPELANFDLTGSAVNEDFITELLATFAQFHNKQFRHCITTCDDGKTCRIDLYPNKDDACSVVNRFEEIKTNRYAIADGVLATTYKIEFEDRLENLCDITAVKEKPENETTYTLFSVKDEEMRGLLEGKVITLLQNDLQSHVSTLYYSEDVFYESPWKVEHSFYIEGHKFKLVILLEENYFFLETDGDSTMEAFSDKLAAYIVIKVMENESNSKE